MSLDSLHQRIDKMLAAIEQQRGPAEETFYSGIRNEAYLLTEQERADMLELLAVIEPKTGLLNGCLHDLRSLTDSERDKLSLWVDLLEALRQEDIETAAKCRRYLNQDTDALITQFMSLDEQRIPGWDSATSTYPHAPKTQRDGVHYTLHRTNFRSTRGSIQGAIARNRLASDDFNTMRMWLETFGQEVVR